MNDSTFSVTWRAEHVGSLIRPQHLVGMRMALMQGKGDPVALKAAEDEAIRAVVKRQEEAGLDVVTDGEFRRFSFLGDVTSAVEGFTFGELPNPDWFREDGTTDNPGSRGMVVTGTLKPHRRIAAQEAGFLKEVATRPFKVMLPSPLVVAQSSYQRGVSESVYPTMTDMLWAIADILRDEYRQLAEEGVPYLQIDNPGLAYYLDPALRERAAAVGVEVDIPLDEAIKADAHVISEVPSRADGGPVVGLHLCRGNWQSAWLAEGAYTAVAEDLFAIPRVDRFLLEYDTPRAGGFEPLRALPDDKVAVLGLLSSKHGRLEDEAEVRARIDEAATIVPLERLALSPQCGFATSIPGNRLDEADQWRKLEIVASIARRVWG